MQISTVTGFLYCVNFNLHGDMKPSSVSVVDPETMTEITRIKTGSMPHGSRITSDGLKQYSVAMMSGELFEIDALSLEVSRILDLEDHSKMDHSKMDHSEMKHSNVKPTWVIPHPNKNVIYIAGNGSDEIIEVDSDSWKVSKRIKTGKGPYNVEISPNGKYLAIMRSPREDVCDIEQDKIKGVEDEMTYQSLTFIDLETMQSRVFSDGVGEKSIYGFQWVSDDRFIYRPGLTNAKGRNMN